MNDHTLATINKAFATLVIFSMVIFILSSAFKVLTKKEAEKTQTREQVVSYVKEKRNPGVS